MFLYVCSDMRLVVVAAGDVCREVESMRSAVLSRLRTAVSLENVSNQE